MTGTGGSGGAAAGSGGAMDGGSGGNVGFDGSVDGSKLDGANADGVVQVGNLAGGGCACSSAPGAPGGSLALALLLGAPLALFRRRSPRPHTARIQGR
jgi:MYXO-CTERM domain-containing protein